MALHSGRNHAVHFTLLFLGALLALFAVCDEPGPTQQVVSIEAFRLTQTDYPEWREQQYTEYDSTSFFQLINGGAQFYDDHGLVSGTYQDLRDDSLERICELFVMDFGSAAAAKHVFEEKKTTMSQITQLGDYPQTTAMKMTHLSGIQGYAHFGQHYFEVLLSGYSDAAVAEQLAVSILQSFAILAQ